MQLIQGLWYTPFPVAPAPQIEGDNMKSAVMFRDQVNAVVNWFEQWNECEQTVALYSLFKKLQPIQARFLSLVLEQTYSSWLDLKVHEQEANDPEFISSFCNESKENAVKNMLFHLPLLHPGNEEAKYQYLSLIPKILAHSIENSVHIEESRQLLSYSLLHPAISDEDRRSLSQWLRHLEDSIHNCGSVYFNPTNGRSTNGNNEKLSLVNGNSFLSDNGYNSNRGRDGWCGNPTGTSSLLDFGGKEGAGLISMNNNCSSISGLGSNSLPTGLGITRMPLQATNNQAHGVVIPPFHSAVSHTLPLYQSRLMRSNSLTPPISDNHLSMQPSHGYSSELVDANVNWLSNCGNGDQQSSPFHSNLKSQVTNPGGVSAGYGQQDHAPLSPQSSIASSGSGSESHPEEKNSFNTEGSGMKDVPSWLKTLRLHKYAHLFSQMTYEEMMNLSEEQLESHNVTKGARHKIVLSITKLRERSNILRSLENDLVDEESLKNALAELKAVIQTPMKAYGENSNEIRDRHASGASPPGSPINGVDTSSSDGSNNNVPEDDLPGLFTRVMGKICSNLLVQARPEYECLNLFLMLIEKCLSHEAFNPTQKRRLFSWKQQVQKVWHPLPPRRSLDNRQNKRKWNPQSPNNVSTSSPNVDFSSSHLQKGLNAAAGSAINNPPPASPVSSTSSVMGLHHQNGNNGAFRKSPGIPGSGQSSHSGVGLVGNTLQSQQQSSQEYLSRLQQTGQTQQRTPQSMVVKRPSLQDHLKPHVNIQRTHSAPVRFNALTNSLLGKPIEDMSGDPEINTRLESLCLSMTEHALESLDENPDSLTSPCTKSK